MKKEKSLFQGKKQGFLVHSNTNKNKPKTKQKQTKNNQKQTKNKPQKQLRRIEGSSEVAQRATSPDPSTLTKKLKAETKEQSKPNS